MGRAAAILGMTRRESGRLGTLAALMRAWGRVSMLVVLLTLSLVLVGEGALADLAPTSGGRITTDFGGDDFAFALILQPDGKPVAAGGSDAGGFALARYLPDGHLDPSFGGGGTVTTDFGGGGAFALAIVLQPDGKLVAAGYANGDFALARYLPDGRLDPTFGMEGTVTTDFGGFDAATSLVLQPDGKLTAAGGTSLGFTLARYLADGRLDPSFGVGGIVTSSFIDEAKALVLQPDGKLVAAGQILTGDGGIVLARYLADGRLDPSFGMGGIVTTDFGGAEDVHALVLQPDGKLVAAGDVTGGDVDPNDFALARYLPDGRLDLTFGVGGTVTTDFGDAIAVVYALVLQLDGKLVAAGLSFDDFALARYLPDGRLDPSFGVGGRVTTNLGGTGGADALVLQPDGKLVAAGTSFASGSGDFALARYLPDGSLDPTFGTGVEINVNALVTFEPIASTFTFTPDPTGCPEGFVGTFSFEARLTNSSDSALTDLVVVVTTLTHDNLLQNADGGPGGAGARLTVPQQDGFSEGVLSPDELVDVPFIICLQERQPFTFVVDVLGVVEASAAAHVRAQPVP